MVKHDVSIELTVKQLKQNNSTCKTVIFKRPINFKYEAGDWIDIDFADTSYKGGKTYSLSSSPTESELSISFREGNSPFKKQLQSVETGDKMYISQYGNDYGFHLHAHHSSVLIAGGIGVAPFRSMLKEMFDIHAKNTVQLIYLNGSDDFLFKSELELWKQALPNISVEYIITKDLKSKARDQLLQSLILGTASNYYIAGPTQMVKSTAALLNGICVAAKDTRIDNFGLY